MYAVLDIETTGGKYDEEGIMEIAIYRYDGFKVVDQFASLINPQRKILPYVQKLTDINSKMLTNAPKFFEVAKRIIEITEDCVLVAHNAKFDRRVLQTEFRRLGFDYKRKSLCTIEFSKILFPEQKSYNLGKLVRELGIPITNQHQAQNDARATLQLFELLLEKDTEKTILKQHIKNSHLDKISSKHLNIIDSLPTEMGVYYIHGKNDKIVYIGKSKNLKKSVLSHLTGTRAVDVVIQKHLKEVSCSLTGNELITLLKSQHEIEANRPEWNVVMDRKTFPIGIRLDKERELCHLIIESIKENRKYISVFKSRNEAKKKLHSWIEMYNLYLNETNLENGASECNYYEDDKRKYSCLKNESSTIYNERIKSLESSLRFPYESFLLIGQGRKTAEYSFIYTREGAFQGYGFYELNHQIKSKKQIEKRLIPVKNDNIAENIMRWHIDQKKYLKLISL